ncbi:MAG TPA: Gfo/Idh/MocA family oxidoreductase [Candidatus Hydrogenedentes bacterium]|nr:Gfo/Idh/MocA family oxidoreductase [Candidatus Hydrogenedentota bacterium]
MKSESPGTSTRREFMRNAAAGAASVAAFSILHSAQAQDASKVLRVGLIGCGGRGTGAAREALLADPNVQLVAMADTFADQIDGALGRLRGDDKIAARVVVDDTHKFAGFDGYKNVIESCDVIVHGTPPGPRPLHVRAAVDAGKHMFIEKPVAVDAPGVRSMMESCRIAREKNLVLVSGLCYRYQFAKRETIKRIQDGAIGDIVAMQTTYNTGGLWHKGHDPKWSEMEYQIRNWLYFDWISGDHINEQHIHSLDKIMWVMKDVPPAKCTASGGRAQRTDPKYGNIYDHFNCVFEWANDVRCFSSCRQWESTSTDVSDWIFGTNGKANIQEHYIRTNDGKEWRYEGAGEDNMYQNEHNAFFAAIRKGESVVNEYMCTSTLLAILGRTSAYTGKTLTWDQMLNSQLDLTPKVMEWGDNPMNPLPVPGQTPFV